MKYVAGVIAALILAGVALAIYTNWIANPKVAQELRANPTGERAKKVLLLKLPSGKELPINYLREENKVFAGGDGPWWKELRAGPGGAGHPVEMWIRGETHRGTASVIENDPDYTLEIFKRLRPTSYWVPWGVLVEIRLDEFGVE